MIKPAGRYLLFLIITLVATAPACGAEPWQLDYLPIQDVKPGMKGFAKTVFAAETVESFGVEVVDVVRGFYPQQDIFIVRLSGEQAERNGVVSGMSGSPVYLNGKLAGALALRFGDFQKEPIAGVMPIEAMIRTRDFESDRPEKSVAPVRMGAVYLNAILMSSTDSLWQRVLAARTPPPQNSFSVKHIDSPLLLSGFSSQVISALQPCLTGTGLVPVAGGSTLDAASVPTGALQPGDAVSQVFISGDLGMEMTGTVTAVDRDRVLAFGHPIFNIGPTQMPMARTHILATIPSLMGSNKLGKSVEIVGTFRQDRLSGLYGELGTMPQWIPVDIFVQLPAGEKRFHLNMASDPAFANLMPFFLRSAVFQTLVSSKMGADPSTIRLRYDIHFAGGDSLHLQDFISYEERLGFMGAGSELAEAADVVAISTGAIMVNDFVTPAITSLTVRAEIEPGERLTRIQDIRQDHVKVEPGDSLRLVFVLRQSDGEEMKFSQSIRLPQYLQARNLIVVAGGAAALTLLDVQSNPDKYRPRSFSQLCRILSGRRRANHLYVQIRESAPGIAVKGEAMPSLPPSILGVMSGKGSERSLHDRILREWSIETPCEVAGLKRITVKIEQPRKQKRTPDNSLSITPTFEW